MATIDLEVIPNVDTENAVIPLKLNFDEVTENINQPTTSNILTNTQNKTFHQAPIMFQGATFSNCQITSNIPK